MSFRFKIVFLILTVALIPYILMMVYSGNTLRDKYYENTQQEMQTQLYLSVQRIEQYLDTLKRDIIFLSNLDVMNDIYSKDVDRRISHLLQQKKKELDFEGDFHLIDVKNEVLASSNPNMIFKKINFKPFFLVDVKSKFDKATIGQIVVEFSLQNITNFFENTPNRHYYIVVDKTKVLYKKDSFANEIHVRKPLSIQNIEIVLEQNQDQFLDIIRQYEKWYAIAFILGALIIVWIALYFIDRLIQPIIELSHHVERITKTRDYSQSITITSGDEIGKLERSFNKMLVGIKKALNENELLNKEIEDTQKEVVFTMGAIGESRSQETGNHVKRVAEYSKILALSYGLGEKEAELLKQASPMHDVGKIAISDAILNKPAKFTPQEFEIMKEHTSLGYEMLKHSKRPLLQAAAIVAKEHHEKWDGTGYPEAKKAKEIHIYARITAISDVFDALGSDRVYKKAWDDERIFQLFRDEKGKHFDPKLVDIFFENLDKILYIRNKFKDS